MGKIAKLDGPPPHSLLDNLSGQIWNGLVQMSYQNVEEEWEFLQQLRKEGEKKAEQ